MRAIPDSLDPAVVAEVDTRLDAVARDHGVRIPWAIESGSRAWGFPSPDSDYDCRFVYVRPQADYLSLWRPRDVIETPLDEVFDVNGWDLAKAVKLVAKGNATVLEWLRSPIVYTGDAAFRDRMLAFADDVVDRNLILRHYLHVARQQLADGSSLKRFFYVLRPAAALRWLADHPGEALPPMDLPTLLAESSVGSDVREATRQLIAAKAVTRELGAGSRPEALTRFVEAELERATRHDETVSADERASASRVAEVQARADAWFRAELDSASPHRRAGS